MLKAHQEYLRSNYKKAVKYLCSINMQNDNFIQSGDSLNALVSNAFGCVYGQLNKPQLSHHYFNTAQKHLLTRLKGAY